MIERGFGTSLVKPLLSSAFFTVLILLLSSCGFKSDLFLPGEPVKVDQLDKSTLETMKDETMESLREQDPGTLDEATGLEIDLSPLDTADETNEQKKEKNK